MGDIRDLPVIDAANISNSRVLLRVDLNVPISNGEVHDKTRIERIAPTVEFLVKAKAKVVMISHLGRPKAREEEFSLKQVVDVVSKVLGVEVTFIPDITREEVDSVIDSLPWGSVVLLENLRFFAGEVENDLGFAGQLASLADIYVNDAFSCSHRKHASVDAIMNLLPSFAGFNLQEELNYLAGIVSESPGAAIIGGAKTSVKIPMLRNFASRLDFLILGGSLSTTFLDAMGFKVGNSFFEKNVEEALAVIEAAKESGCKIILPVDHAVAQNLEGPVTVKDNNDITMEDSIFDIGEKTSRIIEETIRKCKTIFWNGPLGVFEHESFKGGTERLTKALVSCHKENGAKTIIGGGDSIFAMRSFGYCEQDFSYVSTGGGALLHFLAL
ncbi:phosphoglycerate kinase [Anaplasma phagocytophilum]|uniref:Phosphoglycerate kinase n=1 Tax=Anaplasma phagocytophilum str. ApMUC09 TaxID=1359152 RepID=A0A0F3N997_ANAPH|nr:phosphoglycerate kinase [Anaplasma phagocytophilum]KJV64638.1 phosphoglycerate kinase family protein [Anaplasma phagocytophilum str. ApMUC09]SBO32472.1 Bifunctional PGK/TIM [Anaplasma phagocytophilum]SBO32870.1 Bifunctional PGK/TIM [Anaplasma phagocytophilum]SBO33015.1 Bifunctional PGK/TIM [Anaplasma phagocytophilum]SCV63473.1 Bifunctional PGK/TIM [Anaplasma phagocytophilum]